MAITAVEAVVGHAAPIGWQGRTQMRKIGLFAVAAALILTVSASAMGCLDLSGARRHPGVGPDQSIANHDERQKPPDRGVYGLHLRVQPLNNTHVELTHRCWIAWDCFVVARHGTTWVSDTPVVPSL